MDKDKEKIKEVVEQNRKKEQLIGRPIVALLVLAAALLLFNQFQINAVSTMLSSSSSGKFAASGSKELSSVNIDELKSIEQKTADLFIGACVTHNEIIKSPVIKKIFPLLKLILFRENSSFSWIKKRPAGYLTLKASLIAGKLFPSFVSGFYQIML